MPSVYSFDIANMKIQQPAKSVDIRLLTLFPLAFGGVIILFIKDALVEHDSASIQRFSTLALSLIVEALPFLLVGSIIGAIIHLFLSEDTLARLVPRNRFLGVLMACIAGMALPVCDCATVPIVRRLLGKGVPLHVAVTFMLAVPMVNPLVIFSTWFAFYQHPLIIAYRIGFGLLISIAVGLAVSILDGKYWVVPELLVAADSLHSHPAAPKSVWSAIRMIVEHATEDFFEIGKYFLAGVLFSTFIQSVLPVATLATIGQTRFLSVGVMIAAAYLLSICSQADAFIAASFFSQFTSGAIVAFLVFGPMIDIKNTLMLMSTLKKRLIFLLVGMIAECTFVVGALLIPKVL